MLLNAGLVFTVGDYKYTVRMVITVPEFDRLFHRTFLHIEVMQMD